MARSRSRQVPAQEPALAFYVGKQQMRKHHRGVNSAAFAAAFFFSFLSLSWTISIDFHKQMEFAPKMLKFPFLVPEYLKCKLNEDRSLYLTHFIFREVSFL